MRPWWLEALQGYVAGWKTKAERRKGIRVIYYHGVVERKKSPLLERNLHTLQHFRSHLDFLGRLRILSLAELTTCWSERHAGDCDRAVVITFDDGYANNLFAAELLAQKRMAWSVFVSTGAVGNQEAIWTVELSLLLLHGSATEVELFDTRWSLANQKEREDAFQAIRYLMKAMPASLRAKTMAELREQFAPGETSRLLETFPSMRMMTWDEVSQLSNAGVEIGSHGVHHEIHHIHQSVEVRGWELTDSKQALERVLNRPCRFFAYPDGGYTPDSPEELKKAGYELAFTTETGTFDFSHNRYLLPRLAPKSALKSFTQDFFWVNRGAH